MGPPRWLSSKKKHLQCRRHRFNPWVGKILWRRKWQLTPVFLPRESHGQRSLVGCKELDMTEQLSMHSSVQYSGRLLTVLYSLICPSSLMNTVQTRAMPLSQEDSETSYRPSLSQISSS